MQRLSAVGSAIHYSEDGSNAEAIIDRAVERVLVAAKVCLEAESPSGTVRIDDENAAVVRDLGVNFEPAKDEDMELKTSTRTERKQIPKGERTTSWVKEVKFDKKRFLYAYHTSKGAYGKFRPALEVGTGRFYGAKLGYLSRQKLKSTQVVYKMKGLLQAEIRAMSQGKCRFGPRDFLTTEIQTELAGMKMQQYMLLMDLMRCDLDANALRLWMNSSRFSDTHLNSGVS